MELCKKKQKNVAEQFFPNSEPGDAYSYLDIKRGTDFFVAFSVGKWVQEVCDELYELIAKRTQQPTYYAKINFCTDGNDQNENAIVKFFNKDCVNYGQVIKDKENQIVYGIHKRKVIGNLPFNEIAINNIDGFCSKLRARAGCFVRKTRNFAKKRKQIRNLLHIIQTNHNFIEAVDDSTPAIREGLTKNVWSWNDVFNARLSIKT